MPKIRHNDKVERDALMKMLASQVGTSEKHVVKMVEPEYMILAEVIKVTIVIETLRRGGS